MRIRGVGILVVVVVDGMDGIDDVFAGDTELAGVDRTSLLTIGATTRTADAGAIGAITDFSSRGFGIFVDACTLCTVISMIAANQIALEKDFF